MKSRETETIPQIELERANQVLDHSDFAELVKETAEIYPDIDIQRVNWDENGSYQELEGVSGTPNAAGYVLTWNKERKLIRTLNGYEMAHGYSAVSIEAQMSGEINIIGEDEVSFSTSKRREAPYLQSVALDHALKHPAQIRYIRPLLKGVNGTPVF